MEFGQAASKRGCETQTVSIPIPCWSTIKQNMLLWTGKYTALCKCDGSGTRIHMLFPAPSPAEQKVARPFVGLIEHAIMCPEGQREKADFQMTCGRKKKHLAVAQKHVPKWHLGKWNQRLKPA